jgi:hypothetical protein
MREYEIISDSRTIHCPEIKRLNGIIDTMVDEHHKLIAEAKADTVREMQTRLTNLFANDENLEYIEVDAEYINEQIDQIAEEMIGGAK